MSLQPPIWTATQPPFTVAQWQELEQQALIFKYLKAGLTVPPHLLAPFHNTLHHHHHHHPPSLGYYSYYGKKIDPEPGRCRRTDGKKWRCSREAHPDSKYCERHMIRRRYRSRKPVESSQAAAAAAAPAIAPNRPSADGGGSGSGSFQNLMPLHTNGAREGFSFGNNNKNNNNDNSFPQQLQLEPFPSEVSKKEYRFGLNSEADEHDFLQKDLGSVRYQGHFTSDGMWSHMSQIPSNSVSESSNGSIVVSNCFQQQTMRDAEPLNVDAARSKQHVSSGHLNSAGCLKQEYRSPPSLFSDWQWKKDLGSPPIEYKPNKDINCNPDVNVDCSGSL